MLRYFACTYPHHSSYITPFYKFKHPLHNLIWGIPFINTFPCHQYPSLYFSNHPPSQTASSDLSNHNGSIFKTLHPKITFSRQPAQPKAPASPLFGKSRRGSGWKSTQGALSYAPVLTLRTLQRYVPLWRTTERKRGDGVDSTRCPGHFSKTSLQCAVGYYLAATDAVYNVAFFNRLQTMCDNDQGFASMQTINGTHDRRLRFVIKCRCCFIQNQYFRIFKQSSCNTDPLTLPAG